MPRERFDSGFMMQTQVTIILIVVCEPFMLACGQSIALGAEVLGNLKGKVLILEDTDSEAQEHTLVF